MVDAGTWKDLFHKRGTGVAVIACRNNAQPGHNYSRLVTEHSICFPHDDGDESFLSVFIGNRSRDERSPILAQIEADEPFSMSFLRYRDRDLAMRLAGSERGGIEWLRRPSSDIPYLAQCNFTLFCEKVRVMDMPGRIYSLLVGRLTDFWMNPDADRPLLNNQQNWVTIDESTAIPVHPNNKNRRLRH